MREPFLEPVLRRLRLAKVLKVVKKSRGAKLLDLGCGWDYRFLRTAVAEVSLAVGIDPKAEACQEGKLQVFSESFNDRLPFADGSFQIVTMLAVLEHLTNPVTVLREIERVLTPGGIVVLTVPSPLARPVLEFLSYRLGVINEDEIRDHKEYYSKETLNALFARTGLSLTDHAYFQCRMNNFCVAKKGAAR